MPYIKVDVDKIKEIQQSIYSIRRKVNTISSYFSNISYQLDPIIKNNSEVKYKLQSIESDLLNAQKVLLKANAFFGDASLKYINAERSLNATDKASTGAQTIDINEIVKTISSNSNLSNEEIADIVLSGYYSIEEIEQYAKGEISTGAFASSIDRVKNNVTKSNFKYSELGVKEIIALAAIELRVSEAEIHEYIDKGLCVIDDIAEFVEGKAKEANKFVKEFSKSVKRITGATKTVFTIKDGYVVVSKFTRNSLFNKLVQKFNNGTGLGTKYSVDGIKGTPVVGKVYEIDQLANKVDNVVNVITAVTTATTDVVEGLGKINDIWANDSLTTKEKNIQTTSVAITTTIGTALDVAAPFAGSAVQKTVATAISAALPGAGVVVGAAVGFIAGQVVEKGMELVADVITSEAVVNQVSDSIEKVGDAVSSGVAAVSNASKELMESKNVGEAVANTAKLVGTAVTAGAKVVATTVVEATKTVTKVVTETAKAVVNTVKNFFKKW